MRLLRWICPSAKGIAAATAVVVVCAGDTSVGPIAV